MLYSIPTLGQAVTDLPTSDVPQAPTQSQDALTALGFGLHPRLQRPTFSQNSLIISVIPFPPSYLEIVNVFCSSS